MKIETERLILRKIDAGDLEGLYDLDANPEVHKYLGGRPIKKINEAQSILHYIQTQYVKDGIGRWAVVDKLSGEFMGWAGLKYEREVREEMDYYDIGYRLRKKFWGQGFATEAALAAMRYGFVELELDEIYGGAHIDNIASNKILQKIGLKHIETFDYDSAPHHWYGVKRSDWLKANQ